MSFFVTSRGIGNGGNLGGLAGADAHCQALAEAVGSNLTWHAYLSTQGPNAVNARDRIGSGPCWQAFFRLSAGQACFLVWEKLPILGWVLLSCRRVTLTKCLLSSRKIHRTRTEKSGRKQFWNTKAPFGIR
jgi:hypothetical protein